MAQSVEHVIGNDEVISSILITSSKDPHNFVRIFCFSAPTLLRSVLYIFDKKAMKVCRYLFIAKAVDICYNFIVDPVTVARRSRDIIFLRGTANEKIFSIAFVLLLCRYFDLLRRQGQRARLGTWK